MRNPREVVVCVLAILGSIPRGLLKHKRYVSDASRCLIRKLDDYVLSRLKLSDSLQHISILPRCTTRIVRCSLPPPNTNTSEFPNTLLRSQVRRTRIGGTKETD
jgi:hypothetical protein